MNARTLKSKVLDIVWDSIKAHSNVSRQFNTSFSSKNNGFQFKFHRYDHSLFILIHPNGDIGIKIKEDSHADQTSSYYCYKATDDHEALLPTLKQDLDLLIHDFYNGMDYNALADLHIKFTLIRKEPDWMAIYSSVRP